MKYITALLNSTTVLCAYKYFYCTTLGDSGIRWLKQHIVDLPIPKITPSNQSIITQIESLVDQILKIKSQSVHQETLANTSTSSLCATPQEGNGVDTSELEQEIDRLVYELYGLTSEEIAVVEGSSKQ